MIKKSNSLFNGEEWIDYTCTDCGVEWSQPLDEHIDHPMCPECWGCITDRKDNK